jgi:hypothetical protein
VLERVLVVVEGETVDVVEGEVVVVCEPEPDPPPAPEPPPVPAAKARAAVPSTKVPASAIVRRCFIVINKPPCCMARNGARHDVAHLTRGSEIGSSYLIAACLGEK